MNFDFAFFWKLFWRRLPVMSIFVIALTVMGVMTAYRLPDVYATSARLLVEAPQLNIVDSSVQVDEIEQLDIIEQKLLTRANLIDIAQKFEVFGNMRAMEPERIVARMTKATKVRRSAGRNKATLMTISFEGRDPRIVSNVVNEFVTLVLEENTDFRISRAESTLTFFQDEVERLAQDLDNQSTAIAVFRSENAEALPQEQAYRLGRQTQLEDKLIRIERDIQALEAQRTEMVNIYESTGQVGLGTRRQARSAEENQLIRARAELELARETYSEENRRVIRLKNRVERLEAIVAAQASADLASPEFSEDVSPERAVLESMLSQLDTRLEFLRNDEEVTTKELQGVQAAITQSAANGIELAALERDFSIIQSNYNAAVNNLNEARMTERIETNAQGQRITILENANVPRVPAGPDRPKIMMAGAAAGIMLAFGYFMLLEIMNRTVRRPAELINRFDISPIATIPYMESRGRRFARRSGLLTATLAVLVGVPALLFYIDTNYLPLEIFVQRGLERLGLG